MKRNENREKTTTKHPVEYKKKLTRTQLQWQTNNFQSLTYQAGKIIIQTIRIVLLFNSYMLNFVYYKNTFSKFIIHLLKLSIRLQNFKKYSKVEINNKSLRNPTSKNKTLPSKFRIKEKNQNNKDH